MTTGRINQVTILSTDLKKSENFFKSIFKINEKRLFKKDKLLDIKI